MKESEKSTRILNLKNEIFTLLGQMFSLKEKKGKDNLKELEQEFYKKNEELKLLKYKYEVLYSIDVKDSSGEVSEQLQKKEFYLNTECEIERIEESVESKGELIIEIKGLLYDFYSSYPGLINIKRIK